MRIWLGTSAGLLLGTPLIFLCAGAGSGSSGEGPPDSHAHGQGGGNGTEVCATGCSAVPALDKELTRLQFERLIADYALQPMSEESEALEALLYYGAATRAHLADSGFQSARMLEPEREAFLRRELSVTQARLDVRIIDEHGTERLSLGDTLVPFGEKQHLHPHTTTSLQPPEVSGTIHRVGLKHLWARL